MAYRGHSSVTIESKTPDKRISLMHSCSSIWHTVVVLFSVANHTLPHRLLTSLVPPLGFSRCRNVYTDLKGPVLVLVMLTAILVYGLMSSERTLATALLAATKLTFGYWLGFSALASILGFLFSTRLSPLQLLAISGYSLTGHCLVLLVAELLHQEDNPNLFFLLTTVFGGLATGRLVAVTLTCTPKPPHRLLLGSTLASIHLMHLVYIHFACMKNKFAV